MDAVIQRLELSKYKLQKERNPEVTLREADPADSVHGV